MEEDGAKLAVRDADGNRAVVYGERQPQPGQKPPEEARAAYRRSLEKMGGTPFPQEVAVRGAQWFLPGSEVNELRRRALESLLAKREQPRPIPCAKVPQALLEAPARAAKQEGVLPSGSRMRRSCRGRPHRTRHGSLCRWPSGATCRRS